MWKIGPLLEIEKLAPFKSENWIYKPEIMNLYHREVENWTNKEIENLYH